MKKKCCIMAILMISTVMVGCGKKEYKDGIFESHINQNSKEEKIEGMEEEKDSNTTILGSADIKITIKNGKIVDCTYASKNAIGEVKDANYGKDAGEMNYKKAQKAVEGQKKYCKLLIEKQNIEEFDVISGATISYNEFVEGVNKALEKAEK